MTEESDWELVSDSEPSEPLAMVAVELPPTGVFPRNKETTSQSCKLSSNSVNSFSIVEGFNTLGVQSESESFSSSNVQPSSSESTVGSSICGQFDLVSLSSGGVFFRCRDCKARNPVGTGICVVCGLAQVPNPCAEADNQVAVAQQQREDRMALDALKFEERQLQNLMNESLPDKAKYLATKLANQLGAQSSMIQGFQEMHLVNLTCAFLQKAYSLLQHRAFAATANLSLGSGYVMTDQVEEMLVWVRGFGSGRKVHISQTVVDALRYGPQSASNQRYLPSTSLSPISENEEIYKPHTCMWIVAVVGSGSNVGVNSSVRGDAVLPLVCLATEDLGSKSAVIGSLSKVLLQVIDDTFTDGLHLKEPNCTRASTFARMPNETNVNSPSQPHRESGRKRRKSNQRGQPKAESGQKRSTTRHKRSGSEQRWQSGPESDDTTSSSDHRWLTQKDCAATTVSRKSTSNDAFTEFRTDSIKLIHQDSIDANRSNRFGILSFFIAGGSMEGLEGLQHDTRTSLRLRNVPSSIDAEWLLHEFTRHGYPPEKFNLFFLPMKPGYRPGVVFLDFVDYKDIPTFCHIFCSTRSESGFQFQPEYTKNQGKDALTAYFECSPIGYCPLSNSI